MTADWKGIYDGITSFAGLKDQALGAGKESLLSGAKEALGVADTFGGKSLGDFAKSQLNMDLGLPSMPKIAVPEGGALVADFSICDKPLNGWGDTYGPFRHKYLKFDDGSTAGFYPSGWLLWSPGKLNTNESGGNCSPMIKTDPAKAQDRRMKSFIDRHKDDYYSLPFSNCQDFVNGAIEAGQ